MPDHSVIIPPKSKHGREWNTLLHEWFKLIDRYSDNKELDVPYWYGERALTGLLASAAWRKKKGWALEEFSAERGGRSRKRNRRGDLWLGVGDAQFTIEAKIYWPQKDTRSAVKGVKRKLNEAKKQLYCLSTKYQVGLPFSVCYVVPWPRVSDNKSNLTDRNALLEHVAQSFGSENCVVGKYVCQGHPRKHGGRAYPGVLLIARQERWKRRKLVS